MKTLYGSAIIDKEELSEVCIEHKIELEYYKIINKENSVKNNKLKFGIKIVKKEYINNSIMTEEKEIKNLSDNEQKIIEILEVLKRNKVTPIGVIDVMLDMSNKYLFL